MPNEEKLAISGKVIPTGDDMNEMARLAHIGEWFENVFACRFMSGNLPRPGTPWHPRTLKPHIP